MRIRYNRPIKASSDGRKWVNTELTQNEWSQLRPYLIKNGYKFEPSGAGDMVHIECYLNDAEINKVDKFIDTIADDIGASCRSKSSVKNSTSKRRAVKAEYRDNTIDKDAVRELVLTITNDGDLYRRQITPAIDNLKRKYKKGNYDRDKAVKLWQYVADEGVRRYNKEFGSGTYSVAWLNPITRKAIAEELRDYYEDEIMYEDNVESACGKRSVNASYGDDDVVMYWDRKKVYEGPTDSDMTRAIQPYLEDPKKLDQIVDYLNSFGDPLIVDTSDLHDVAATFVSWVDESRREADVLDEDFYETDNRNFEIFYKAEEIEGSVSHKSVTAARKKYDTDKAIDVFYESLENLNKFFKGDCVFRHTVGSVYNPDFTSYYEDDGYDFLMDLSRLIQDNSSGAIMDFIEEYESNPLYLAVVNGTEDDYIRDHISGEDMNNIDPTVASGFVDEWYDAFYKDCYELGLEVAESICRYLSYFSDIVETADGSHEYQEDFYEVRIDYFG